MNELTFDCRWLFLFFIDHSLKKMLQIKNKKQLFLTYVAPVHYNCCEDNDILNPTKRNGPKSLSRPRRQASA